LRGLAWYNRVVQVLAIPWGLGRHLERVGGYTLLFNDRARAWLMARWLRGQAWVRLRVALGLVSLLTLLARSAEPASRPQRPEGLEPLPAPPVFALPTIRINAPNK